ncbi:MULTISPECIES: FecCD family ABC transporter permease [Paenibacillus]|uniref:FecCD family ABC transporter permease n=1 Tax=Paenibacillus TaxID=44249 RepID=UPI0022B8E826|nr:iron ABC transporter permease [Paenibacillus caseinilyticus]MCZ8519586.1 iron ABC transporter permease [Paenibacillus caseinilyticus]
MILAAALPVLLLTMLLSVMYGAKSMEAGRIAEAFLHFDAASVDHQIIMHSRLPRVIGALLVGAFLAVSGALMQGITRNDLASPSIMGITDGSAFAVTVCMVAMPYASSMGMILASFAGSLLSIAMVFGMASLLPGGMSPVRLAILGTLTGTFLSSAASAIAMYFQVSQNISFWYNARLHLMDPKLIVLAVPFAAAGLLIALGISKSITISALGDEMAVSLGQNTVRIKLLATLSVILLTGVSVAIGGRIGFVGLIIPHLTRFLTGLDYRHILPCSAVIGGVFLALCDVLSRFLNYPYEMPIGVVTAIIGVPYFLYLIRTRGGKSHR